MVPAHDQALDRPQSQQPTDADLAEVRAIAENSARYFGAKSHEIDDVVQLTLIKVWEQWNNPHMVRARHRRGIRWASYIRKITKHTHLDLVRSHVRRLERDSQGASIRREAPRRPGVDRHIEHAVEPVDRSIGRTAIIELIDQLPERQRLVATLVLIEELTPTEISKLLDWDPQAVRKSLRAARERLKTLIGEGQQEPAPSNQWSFKT